MTRFSSAHAIAEAIRSGKKSAVSTIQETLNTLRTQDHGIQSVTHLLQMRLCCRHKK